MHFPREGDSKLFRTISSRRELVLGAALHFVRSSFGNEIPTVAEYASKVGIHASTFKRVASALRWPLWRFLRRRRPGPSGPQDKSVAHVELSACRAANDLLLSLLPEAASDLLDSPTMRASAVQVALHWKERGVALGLMAAFLGLCTRTLRRWIRRFQEDGGGEEVPFDSRRPKSSPAKLPDEIVETLRSLRQLEDFATLSIAAFTRLFNMNFKGLLEKHDRESVSAKTVARYVSQQPSPSPHDPSSDPRGQYNYPPSLMMAWIDTTYFKVADTTIHIVGAMEANSRVSLTAEAFVQENTAATLSVLDESLRRIPQLGAVVRDRGTPYLNAAVDEYLRLHQVLAITAYRNFPIDKAALERFWKTLKDWLRYALIPYEKSCEQRNLAPSPEELLLVVKPALRVFRRAYNFIPQPHLEKRSPLARLDRALHDVDGGGTITLDPLHQLAEARAGKRDILTTIHDTLQLALPLDHMLRDLSSVSFDAIVNAWDACLPKFHPTLDPKIHSPYPYFLAVARNKEKHQRESRSHRQCEQRQQRQYQETQRKLEADCKAEEQELRTNPENRLAQDLEAWLKHASSPSRSLRQFVLTPLTNTLRSLWKKLGTAFLACIDENAKRIPSLLARVDSHHSHKAEILAVEFRQTARRVTVELEEPPKIHPATLESSFPRSRSDRSFAQVIRKALASILGPHDDRTYVPP